MLTTDYFRTPTGARIAYSMQGEGKLLIFLHGIGGNKRNWQPQFSSSAKHFTSLAWDARGYGDSADDPPLGLFADFADDLAGLVSHLDSGPAHIVGLSMGGMIALDLVDRYPDLLASLVLADSAAGFGPSTVQERAEFLDRRLTPLLAGASLSELAPTLLEVLITKDASAEVRQMVLDSLLRLRTQPYMQTLKAFTTTDFSSSVARITKPTLVIVGAEDRVLPVQKSEALASCIHDARLVVIPACGHLSNIECADAFNAHVGAFLSGIT